MTWAIFAITANDVSPSGCSAFTYHQNSYDPYMRAPFYQLSEQMLDEASINGGTHPAYPFLTGHGGANQVVLFGYLGLRLLPDDAIHIDPNLPPQVSNVAYRTFYWRGWPISASSNRTHTTISRAANVEPLDTADSRFANATISVLVGDPSNSTAYRLPATGPLVVPNRQIGFNNTIPGNMVQCRPVYSPHDYVPGQFPIAAVDGATSTKWQPSTANMSSLTVALADIEINSKVSGFQFNWWQAPPVNATVIFHDEVLEDPVAAMSSAHGNSQYKVVTTLTNIEQSQPYNAQGTDYNVVAMSTGNTTEVNLSQTVHTSRYATLLISGNQGGGEKGATVAEWAILGEAKGPSSGHGNNKRRLDVRAAAALSGGLNDRRWQQFNA
jgi:hypothetical protein